MHSKIIKSLILLLCTLTLSCNTNDDETVTKESIGLETQKASSFIGKTTIENHKLSYQVTSDKEGVFDVDLKIDEKELKAAIFFTDEHIDFNSNDVILTDKDKEILLELGEEISLYLFKEKSTDNFSLPEYTLLRLLEYWGKSPEGYVLHKRSTKSTIPAGKAAKNVNEGITCIRKNTYIIAEYDDKNGNSISERVKSNAERCLGRCGAGCPSFFSLASAWTKDCLDHDRCGRALGGSTNPFDRNCGDEFADAADDYLFGVIRGCSG